MNKKIIVIGLLFAMFSCDEYLDIVPDQTQQIDLLFERKEVAYTALATCYAYLPKNDGVYTSFMMMSDEVTTPISKETDSIFLAGSTGMVGSAIKRALTKLGYGLRQNNLI